jgi:hypothetical protein
MKFRSSEPPLTCFRPEREGYTRRPRGGRSRDTTRGCVKLRARGSISSMQVRPDRASNLVRRLAMATQAQAPPLVASRPAADAAHGANDTLVRDGVRARRAAHTMASGRLKLRLSDQWRLGRRAPTARGALAPSVMISSSNRGIFRLFSNYKVNCPRQAHMAGEQEVANRLPSRT